MSERIYLLPAQEQGGTYYKANLHCHTIYSDGHLSPEEVKKAYQEQGYSVIAYTDHRTYQWHRELTDEHFLALAAMEVDINEHYKVSGDFSKVKTYHINLYDSQPETFQEKKSMGLLPERRYSDTDYINEYIDEMKTYGFFACYNHPYWSLQNYDDYKNLRGFWGMEIYNYGCEHDGLYGYNPQSYDEMLRLGNRLYCVATDDNHNSYPFDHPFCDSFGGFTMIHAKELSYKEITESLLTGKFYSSMGPEIRELYVEDGTLFVKTSPVKKIYVMTEGRNCYHEAAAQNDTITEASFKLSGLEGYIRIDCQDSRGLHANTNAYEMNGTVPYIRRYEMRR